MTTNQIRYRELQEQRRHNVASEQLGLQTLNESIRHNIATHTEARRSNIAKETETNRHNLASELEVYRANRAGEELSRNRLELDWSKHEFDANQALRNLNLQWYEAQTRAEQAYTQRVHNQELVRLQDEQNEIAKLNASINQQNADTREQELSISRSEAASKELQARASKIQADTSAANLDYQKSVRMLERQLLNAENTYEQRYREYTQEGKRVDAYEKLVNSQVVSNYTGAVTGAVGAATNIISPFSGLLGLLK